MVKGNTQIVEVVYSDTESEAEISNEQSGQSDSDSEEMSDVSEESKNEMPQSLASLFEKGASQPIKKVSVFTKNRG